MKSIISSLLIYILFIIPTVSNAQTQPTFSFTLYAEDSLHNRDSIVLGLHSGATYGLDTAFGEKPFGANVSNVNSQTLKIVSTDNGVGVGVAYYPIQDKQIIPYSKWCDTGIATNISLIIYSEYPPVKLSYDKSIFHNSTDSCIKKSYFLRGNKSTNPSKYHFTLERVDSIYTDNGFYLTYPDTNFLTSQTFNPGLIKKNFVASFNFAKDYPKEYYDWLKDTTKGGGAYHGSSIGSAKEDKNFRLYPNPAKDLLNIQSTLKGTMSIFNIEGKTVSIEYAIIPGQNPIRLPKLPSGTYYARFTPYMNKDVVVKKFEVIE